jgi:hypothetical protein
MSRHIRSTSLSNDITVFDFETIIMYLGNRGKSKLKLLVGNPKIKVDPMMIKVIRIWR